MSSDTIYALATAPGRAAVAIVRLSGRQSISTLQAMASTLPPPRMAALRSIRDGDGRLLDRAMILTFPGPSSYTGEDVVELHLHGGTAVVSAVVEYLATRTHLRLAEPGEFTRRAFENGKLDLAQAEAVADLVDAETTAQRAQALNQLGGALSDRHSVWREKLIDIAALLEAAVDFPDEDLPEVVSARVAPQIDELSALLAQELEQAARGQRVRRGYRVALLGPPNAGKSTLLNALVGQDAAIVTPVPGTTRDVVEVTRHLSGYSVCFADTAGLRETNDVVEAEGVRRAEAWARAADLRLWITDGAVAYEAPPDYVRGDDLVVRNKADLGPVLGDISHLNMSAHNADDVAALLKLVADRVVKDLAGHEYAAVTRARHETALRSGLTHLQQARATLGMPELAADEVEQASRSLRRITGSLETEQVLSRVFSSFCIGK